MQDHPEIFIKRLVGQFPVMIDDGFVNKYPLLLDGTPIATAYLVSRRPSDEQTHSTALDASGLL